MISDQYAPPHLVLKGPVRQVELKQAGSRYGQWVYPWPDLESQDKDNNKVADEGCLECFFPDSKHFDSRPIALQLHDGGGCGIIVGINRIGSDRIQRQHRRRAGDFLEAHRLF
jgi:hypothetical protein